MFFKKKKKPINIGNYKLNLQRDNEDSRDFKLRSHITSYEPLPKSVDLRPFMPTVFSQGNFGSCTSNGAIANAEYLIYITKGEKTILSRMYHYNKEYKFYKDLHKKQMLVGIILPYQNFSNMTLYQVFS